MPLAEFNFRPCAVDMAYVDSQARPYYSTKFAGVIGGGKSETTINYLAMVDDTGTIINLNQSTYNQINAMILNYVATLP